MAVALKDVKKEAREKNLRLAPDQDKVKKVEYQFPYDDMYLLYDYIMKEKN
ncbi:MAG TPA: hypothetical protein GXX59_06025 [Syntrophomonadaceae bacterium]|nr:hypothetical protein [Syntrophomonadaceae bacterium]